MPRSRHASFPFVIVSGYGTNLETIYSNVDEWERLPKTIRWYGAMRAWRARTFDIAMAIVSEIGGRRKRLAIVRDFGTKRERVVWERNR